MRVTNPAWDAFVENLPNTSVVCIFIDDAHAKAHHVRAKLLIRGGKAGKLAPATLLHTNMPSCVGINSEVSHQQAIQGKGRVDDGRPRLCSYNSGARRPIRRR